MKNKISTGEIKTYEHPIFEKFEEDFDQYLIIDNCFSINGVNWILDDKFKDWLNSKRPIFVEKYNLKKLEIIFVEVTKLLL